MLAIDFLSFAILYMSLRFLGSFAQQFVQKTTEQYGASLYIH